jgi:hypothetical protein
MNRRQLGCPGRSYHRSVSVVWPCPGRTVPLRIVNHSAPFKKLSIKESSCSILDFYGMGHNEMLIGRAIQGRREMVILSVKFGAMRTPRGAFIGVDGGRLP